MEYYITAMRSAATKCQPWEIKPVFDHLLEMAQEEYTAGALDVTEFGDIINEYADTLRYKNAINYV